MTKQEEIREGIALIIMSSWGKDEKSEDTAYDVMSYLHSKGAAIVKRGDTGIVVIEWLINE